MISITICDDDFDLCKQLEDILYEIQELIPEKYTLNIFNSGEKLINEILEEKQFDIIFLDIEMKKVNGIQVGKFIRDEIEDENTKIIYMSGIKDYALDLFKVRPMDFIIKPLRKNQIVNILNKAIKLINKNSQVFLFKYNRVNHQIMFNNIMYFESKGRKVVLHTNDEVYEFYSRLADIEVKISNDFIQIHKSILINYNYVKEYKYDSVLLSNGEVLPISQSNRKKVRTKLLNRIK